MGDKIAQLIIEKCYLWDTLIVDSLNESDRGERGFGSSGK
jgi:dUTPase